MAVAHGFSKAKKIAKTRAHVNARDHVTHKFRGNSRTYIILCAHVAHADQISEQQSQRPAWFKVRNMLANVHISHMHIITCTYTFYGVHRCLTKCVFCYNPEQSQTRKKTAQKTKSSPRKRLISPKKNKSQVKRPKTNPSADKAKSNESDRIGSLILASLDLEPPSKSAKVSPVSSPKDDSQSDGSPKEEVPNLNEWSPDYGYDDTGMTDDDLYSVRSGVTASSHHSRYSLNDTLSGRSSSGVISPPSFSMPRDLHCNSPTTSAVFGDCYPANRAGPSYSYSPFSPMPPYGMTHSQSWPPSDQVHSTCCATMLSQLV